MSEVTNLTFYERNLADDLIGQALDSFLEIGAQYANPPRPKITPSEDLTMYDLAMAAFANRNTMLSFRLSCARNAVLFAAIAVEAAANYYAAARLIAADRQLVDELPTPKKLLLMPRLAGRGDLFVHDREPLGLVRALFGLRNRIVHPKVGKRSVAQLNSEDFTPANVCGQLIGAAHAITILAGDLEDGEIRGISFFIVKHQTELRNNAKTWNDPPSAPGDVLRRAADLLAKSSGRQLR